MRIQVSAVGRSRRVLICVCGLADRAPPPSYIALSPSCPSQLQSTANDPFDLSDSKSPVFGILGAMGGLRLAINCVGGVVLCGSKQGRGTQVCAGSVSSHHASDQQTFQRHLSLPCLPINHYHPCHPPAVYLQPPSHTSFVVHRITRLIKVRTDGQKCCGHGGSKTSGSYAGVWYVAVSSSL
jgi:hypothetical protein